MYSPYQPDSQANAINTLFRSGKEYVFTWSPKERAQVLAALDKLDTDLLSTFDPSLSYEGTDKKTVYRKSCWFASPGIGKPLCSSEAEIAQFDGDLKDGLTGLRALQTNPELRESLLYLQSVMDYSLLATATALGVPTSILDRCTTRYRAIKYVAHAQAPGGIGLHPDGNLLSSLITNAPGLRVYDLDGTVRRPGYDGTILMGGSTLYRWSGGAYIPTFHDVEIGREENKISIVAFLNFPDREMIPRPVRLNLEGKAEQQSQQESKKSREANDAAEETEDWFHDVRVIKEDDKSPKGELSKLWDIIIDRHHLVLPN